MILISKAEYYPHVAKLKGERAYTHKLGSEILLILEYMVVYKEKNVIWLKNGINRSKEATTFFLSFFFSHKNTKINDTKIKHKSLRTLQSAILIRLNNQSKGLIRSNNLPCF